MHGRRLVLSCFSLVFFRFHKTKPIETNKTKTIKTTKQKSFRWMNMNALLNYAHSLWSITPGSSIVTAQCAKYRRSRSRFRVRCFSCNLQSLGAISQLARLTNSRISEYSNSIAANARQAACPMWLWLRLFVWVNECVCVCYCWLSLQCQRYDCNMS